MENPAATNVPAATITEVVERRFVADKIKLAAVPLAKPFITAIPGVIVPRLIATILAPTAMELASRTVVTVPPGEMAGEMGGTAGAGAGAAVTTTWETGDGLYVDSGEVVLI
jgi:hypothetical protein